MELKELQDILEHLEPAMNNGKRLTPQDLLLLIAQRFGELCHHSTHFRQKHTNYYQANIRVCAGELLVLIISFLNVYSIDAEFMINVLLTDLQKKMPSPQAEETRKANG